MTELTMKIIISLAEKKSSMNVMAISIKGNMYTSSQKTIQLSRAAYMETSAATLIKVGINRVTYDITSKPRREN